MAEHISKDEWTKIVRSTKGGQQKIVYINREGKYVSERHSTAAAILNVLITIGEIFSLTRIFKRY